MSLESQLCHLKSSTEIHLRKKTRSQHLWVVGAAGPQYATTIISKTKIIANSNKDVTCDELIEAMSKHWRMSGEGKGFAEDEPTETALTNTGKSDTKWKYYNCDKVEHLARDYPEEKRLRTETPCKLCNQMGHEKAFCWEDSANAQRRPRGWVSRLKMAKTGEEASASCIEVLV